MDIVNPFDSATWRNFDAPHIDPFFQTELTRIGGVVPSGEFAGKPQLILEWGQRAMAFRCGKMRLKYVDSRIPARETRRRFLWRFTQELDHLDRETGLPVFKKEVRPVDEAPAVIPAGLFYHEDLPELEWIGQQVFYVAQWKPPELLGDEQAWEKNRFENWENPETGKTEWTDMVGPFPRSGRYEPIFAIAQERTAMMQLPDSFLEGKHKFVEAQVKFYAAPERRHIEAIKRAWKEREENREKTSLELSREAFARDKEIREAAKAASASKRNYALKDISEARKIKVYQQSPNLQNMPTRFGKGRRIK